MQIRLALEEANIIQDNITRLHKYIPQTYRLYSQNYRHITVRQIASTNPTGNIYTPKVSCRCWILYDKNVADTTTQKGRRI